LGQPFPLPEFLFAPLFSCSLCSGFWSCAPLPPAATFFLARFDLASALGHPSLCLSFYSRPSFPVPSAAVSGRAHLSPPAATFFLARFDLASALGQPFPLPEFLFAPLHFLFPLQRFLVVRTSPPRWRLLSLPQFTSAAVSFPSPAVSGRAHLPPPAATFFLARFDLASALGQPFPLPEFLFAPLHFLFPLQRFLVVRTSPPPLAFAFSPSVHLCRSFFSLSSGFCSCAPLPLGWRSLLPAICCCPLLHCFLKVRQLLLDPIHLHLPSSLFTPPFAYHPSSTCSAQPFRLSPCTYFHIFDLVTCQKWPFLTCDPSFCEPFLICDPTFCVTCQKWPFLTCDPSFCEPFFICDPTFCVTCQKWPFLTCDHHNFRSHLNQKFKLFSRID
jgi:hypothetical protein